MSFLTPHFGWYHPAFAPASTSSAPVVNFPLDGLSVAPSVWWNAASRDFASYTGSLLQVERTSDNATQDIGYDGNNNLNVALIATFCSGTTGRVRFLYDQTGNNFHISQSTHANQPLIYFTGSQITMGTKPSMDFDGTNDTLTRGGACGLTGSTAWTLVIVEDVDVIGTRFPLTFGNGAGAANAQITAHVASTVAIDMSMNTSTNVYGSISASLLSVPHHLIGSNAAGAVWLSASMELNGVLRPRTSGADTSILNATGTPRTCMGGFINSGGAPAFFHDGRITAGGLWLTQLGEADRVIVRSHCDNLKS